MSIFSDESLLLLSHWDTVQEILAAEKQLRREFPELLFSLESELTMNDWWKGGWDFIRHQDTQMYISHRNWLMNDTYLVWIGVWRFALENFLGEKTSPELYIWVSGERHEFAQQLAMWIENSNCRLLGEIDNRTNGYVVREPVQTFFSGEVKDTIALVRKQILDFICHYAQVVWSFDELIKEFIRCYGER